MDINRRRQPSKTTILEMTKTSDSFVFVKNIATPALLGLRMEEAAFPSRSRCLFIPLVLTPTGLMRAEHTHSMYF